MREQQNAKLVIWAFLLPSSQIISSDAALPLVVTLVGTAPNGRGGANREGQDLLESPCFK